MNLLSGVSDFFGLDIGTTAVRLVELKGTGRVKALAKYAFIPIDSKVAMSDAKADNLKLAQLIKELLTQAQVTTTNVAVGIPSNRVFTTVIDVDRVAPKEIASTIKYQADSLIPTPVAESKIDWALLGDSPVDKNKLEIVLTSVTNNFLEARLDLLESIGLNVIAFEPDSMALSRAIIAADATAPQMVIDVGFKTSDIVIAVNGVPRLARAIPTGMEAILKSATQNLSIDDKQAEQFVFKFGLGKDKLEGQIYHAIISTVDTLVAEIEKSIKFFQTRYSTLKVERIIVTGAAATLPEFPLYIANKFGINVEIGNAWRNVSFPASRQNELLTAANQFSVAAGLAEREE